MQEQIYDLNSKIDFTLLDPRATFSDIERLCDVAYKNNYYSVCVNPDYVSYAKGYIKKNFDSNLKVVSVAAFPLGANVISVKCSEIKQAILDGADEVDFVINISKVKSGDFDYIKNELSKIRKISKGCIIKAILETCYLDLNEIVKVCKLCVKYKIDFVKTSTGFGTAGANDVVLKMMLDTVGSKCQVKASGGIRSKEQAIAYLNLGVSRIGTSRVL